HAVAKGAEDHAEGGGRLALALAGVDDEEALLLGLGGEDLVARGLLLAHLFGVIGVALGLGHEVGFLGRALAHQIRTLVAAVAGSRDCRSPAGSISITCTSPCATGRCMTPRGTT